jgi:hypothetical protein
MDQETLATTLFLKCALPLARVLREDFALYYDKVYYKFNAAVQFTVTGEPDLSTQLLFEDGRMSVVFGMHPKPTVTFEFPNKKALNGFFGGKMGLEYLPKISPMYRLDVVLRVLPLLLQLKIMDPKNLPTDPKKQALKVKLTLYMITSALSQLNKTGDPDMLAFTKSQPDRIYQWTVKDGPAAYLRVKAGKSRSGRGAYMRRSPFLEMSFPDIKGAFMVLTSQAALIDAVTQGYVQTIGSPEYAKEIGSFMQRIEQVLKV